MNRKLSLVAGAALISLTACSMETADTTGPQENSEKVGEVSQALEFDARDVILAALGSATIDCLGGVGPYTYTATTEGLALNAKITSCPSGDKKAFNTIKNILGVQKSQQGQKDKLGSYFSDVWTKYKQSLSSDILCGQVSWKKAAIIHPPTFENVKKHVADNGTFAKENYRYTVDSSQCKEGDSYCNTKMAWECSGGFGSQFRMFTNPKDSSITVDPAWWLVDYEYPDDMSNPFMTPGYYHGMSYFGSLPGDMYGAIERAGERCSSFDWGTGTHQDNAVLVPIDCDGYGWYCMSYCEYTPPVKWEPSTPAAPSST